MARSFLACSYCQSGFHFLAELLLLLLLLLLFATALRQHHKRSDDITKANAKPLDELNGSRTPEIRCSRNAPF